MEYNKNKLVTDDGNNLVSQSLQEGQKVNFDSIIITDTPLPSDRQLSAMTFDNFKNVRTYPITNLKKGNNSVQPEAKLDNNGLTADYPIHAIGLLAHVGESNSTLFGITQNSEGTPAIITKQSQTPYFITYDMAITVTNPDNYTATITPAGYVDQTTFDEEIGKIQTSIKNIDLSDAVKKANNYTDGKVKDLDTQTSQGLANVGQQIGQLLDIGEIKKDVDNRFKGYQDDLDKKQDDVSLSVQNNKLYYNGTPVLIANAPNQPKLDVSIDRDTGYLAYQITPPIVDGGASISNYVISYKMITDDNWQTKQIDGNTLYGQIAGIQKGQNYQLKATATNYAGKSVESETKQILTATEPVGASITITNNIGNMNYEITLQNNGGVSILYYQVFYKKINEQHWQLIDHLDQKGTLSQIAMDGTYQLKAKAVNSAGVSNDSQILQTDYIGHGYQLFNTPTQYSNNVSISQFSNSVKSVNPPIINLNVNISKANLRINIPAGSYSMGNNGSTFQGSSGSYAWKNSSFIVNSNELDNMNIVELSDRMGGNSSSPIRLYIQRINDTTIQFLNYNKEAINMDMDMPRADKGVIPVLQSIEVA